MIKRVLANGACALIAVSIVASCGVTRGDTSRNLSMMIPNSPGGGYDLTGRAAVRIMEKNDITGGSIEVSNIIGAGGSVAMAQLMNEKGNNNVLMTVGLGVVGSLYSFGADYRLQDATPIAQLIEEQEGILVPADSPFKTVDDFVDAWKSDPKKVTIGGGSSPGGPDHLFPMQLASTIGIEPRDARFVTYDGGGPLTTALLGNKIQVGFSGLGEFEGQIASGDLRVLAVSGEERLPGKVADVPTLKESGIDLVFINWRGILAPPGISHKRRAELTAFAQKMHDTADWKKSLKDNNWIDAFKTGDEFQKFLEDQDKRVSGTLKELGLI